MPTDQDQPQIPRFPVSNLGMASGYPLPNKYPMAKLARANAMYIMYIMSGVAEELEDGQ